MKERLQKLLSSAGVCSRRKAEEYIKEGRITLNGKIASLGDCADLSEDILLFDGNPVKKAENLRYIMLNKPRGYVTTLSDESGRKCVSMLVSDIKERLFPIGRLDMCSEGLLLMTNDGELAYKLTHPKHEIYKQYLVKITRDPGTPFDDPCEVLSKPLTIDGIRLLPAKCRMIKELSGNQYIITMSIREGKNRQIRRMCVSCGYTVNSLKRVAIGKLKLGDLQTGTYRELTAEETEYLKSL